MLKFFTFSFSFKKVKNFTTSKINFKSLKKRIKEPGCQYIHYLCPFFTKSEHQDDGGNSLLKDNNLLGGQLKKVKKGKQKHPLLYYVVLLKILHLNHFYFWVQEIWSYKVFIWTWGWGVSLIMDTISAHHIFDKMLWI